MMGEKDGVTEFTFTIPKENIKMTVDPEEWNNNTWAIMRAGLINIMSVAAGMDSNVGKGDKATEIAMMAETIRAMKHIIDDTANNAHVAMHYGPMWQSLDHKVINKDRDTPSKYWTDALPRRWKEDDGQENRNEMD